MSGYAYSRLLAEGVFVNVCQISRDWYLLVRGVQVADTGCVRRFAMFVQESCGWLGNA